MPSNLTEIKAQLDDLNLKLEVTDDKIKEATSTLTVYMLMLNRLNLPYGIDKLVREMIRLKMTVNTLIRAFYLLDIAAGPWGWAKALGTLAVAGVSGYSIYESITGV